MNPSPSSSHRKPRLLDCPACGKQSKTEEEHPLCLSCKEPLPDYLASAILSPDDEKMDETLTASLAAPLPEEVLRKTGNPANLFGKYVLLTEIGRGANGSVVKAWDTYLSRTVALKFLTATASRTVELNDEQRVLEFLREARVAARLHHPNIVKIHEVDCRDNRLYISMDFVSGGTLADLIHGTAEKKVRTRFYLEPNRFLALLRKIALAVHHAHVQDPPVVHRDLKPQNVLIDANDNPYVADFGLANEIRGVPNAGSDGIRGTPAYMAPEQALGRTAEIDPRTDVYSLGIILYEMLTGETPFHGSNIPSVLRKIVSDPPEPPSVMVSLKLQTSREVSSCPAEVRHGLERICLKALSKKRDDRHSSALEFAVELDAVLPKPGVPPTKRLASKRSRLGMLLAGAGVLALLGILLPFLLRPAPPATTPAFADPGDAFVLQAEGYRSSGQWPAFRAAVAEVRNRAPRHSSLPELEAQVAERDAVIQRRKTDRNAALERIPLDAAIPDLTTLRRGIREFPETEDEFRNAWRRTLARLQTSLLDSVRDLAATGPAPAWTTPEMKRRAGDLRVRVATLKERSDEDEDGTDLRLLGEALLVLDRILDYRGTWTLRVNVSPFAEIRILDGNREVSRDFSPSLLRHLEIQPGETLELCWPSIQNPQRRWKTTLPPLKSGTVFVVTGDVANPELQVDRE